MLANIRIRRVYMYKEPASDDFRTIQSILHHLRHFIFYVLTCLFTLRMVIFPSHLSWWAQKRFQLLFYANTQASLTLKVPTQKCSVSHLILYPNHFLQRTKKTVKKYPVLSVSCLCNKLVIKPDRKSELTAALALPNQQKSKAKAKSKTNQYPP